MMPRTRPTSGLRRTLQCAILGAQMASLLGCSLAESTGVTVAVGTVYLSQERASIQVTENPNDTDGCEYIKPLHSDTYWGGLLLQDKALEKTISDLTHDAVKAGANVLLLRSKSKTFLGSSADGVAYRCPPAADAPAAPAAQPGPKPQGQ